MKTERGALRLSAITALVVGCAGVGASFVTDSQAILLDGLFNLAYFVTALLTIKVARLVARPDTEDYPLGYSYFEPLMNGVKGVLILGISVLALIDALIALLDGGRLVEVGLAIGYAVFATSACTMTAVLLRRASRHTGSPLVGADAASWTVNAAISAAALLVFCSIPVITALGWTELTPYADPFLVSVIVLISIAVPVRMAWRALAAMLNRAPPPEARAPIVATIRETLSDLPSQMVYVRMIRPGRTWLVAVHVVLPVDFPVAGLATLDDIRERVQASVRRDHGFAIVDVLFTADRKWAEPTAAAAAEAPTGTLLSPG